MDAWSYLRESLSSIDADENDEMSYALFVVFSMVRSTATNWLPAFGFSNWLEDTTIREEFNVTRTSPTCVG